jgi:hypothetical protein
MKKIVLILICVFGLTMIGSAASSISVLTQNPVKKEAPEAKKEVKKVAVKKTVVKKVTKPGEKKETKAPVKPTTPPEKK